ncbi:MAG: 5'-methylthioadenosine/S-adenosylhomocysteine nucleosidase [Tabrizicola sp.]|nr:5'-methylthioadenosine/S-adenosylhomocysteine nucleosidase [Tabrizicola sp.]
MDKGLIKPGRIKIVGSTRLLFVMAAEGEYGPCLRALCDPLMTGVGPVEAAISVTRRLCDLAAAGQLPHLVVCLGSAGSARLSQREVYQASSVSWRDMDASAVGFPKGETPFLGLPAELPLPHQIAGLPAARLSTGANVISGAGYEAIDADMVDMETYAVLRACQHFGPGVIALRGISDGEADLTAIEDWERYLDAVDKALALACERLFVAVLNGDFGDHGLETP